MTKVLSSDLSKANKDNIDNLELVIETSSKVSTLLDDFISSTPTVLKGSGYDMIRVKVTLYKKAYDVLKNVCENLISIIKGVNNSMINYMEGYTYLDNSQVGELTQYLSNIAAYINYLSQKAAEEGIDYSAEIAKWQELYDKIKHLIELLQGLSGKDSELFGQMEAIIADVENIARMVDGINETTFTKEGLEALKNGTHDIYKFDPDKEIFSEEYKTATQEEKFGNYTRAEIEGMTEEEVRNMSNEEFIEFIGAAAQLVYKERGGILPSVTIAQALLESGYGDHFIPTTYNVYGLRGYPYDKPVVHGSSNYLRQFSNFYEATEAHAMYFEEFSNVFSTCLNYCAQGDGLSASQYLDGYCSAGYSNSVHSLVQQYNLTRFDNI